jgi:hypothetical protein
MRDAREQRTECRKLLALVQRIALPPDLRLRRLLPALSGIDYPEDSRAAYAELRRATIASSFDATIGFRLRYSEP